jgi:ArsR family transcriptional regulator, arsenate/arsenite/antimonite-responsive transcriptional repressor
MDNLIKAAKALSDETRLRMLSILLQRECCVCEVMQVLNISQTRASRNLNILYKAGFLKLRKEGLWVLYSIDESMPVSLAEIVEAVRKALKNNRTAARDRERLKKAKRVGVRCVGNET